MTESNKLIKRDKKLDIETTRYIVRINFTHSKMYIFTANGILIRRITFKEHTETYGEPVTASNDGRYIVLKVPMTNLKQTLKFLNKDDDTKTEDLVGLAFKMTLFEVTPFGLMKIKDIDVMQGIEKFFGGKNTEKFKKFKDQMKDFIYHDNLKTLTKRLSMQVFVNGDADVLIKLSKRHPKDEFAVHHGHGECEHHDHDNNENAFINNY
jgi:hypothetical protein